MSPDQALPEPALLASPYDLTCENKECKRYGTVAQGARCPDCGLRNHLVLPPDEQAPWVPAAKASAGTRPAPVAPIGVGEMLSRTLFGGFWALVTLGLLIAALAGVSNGHAGALLGIPAAALTGLYSAYIFRGGRFRMIFW